MKDEMEFYLQHTGNVEVSDMKRQDLKNLIATGESSFLEFKQKVASPEKIAREIAAFANTDGGKILIGVSDQGEIVGVESYMEEEFWLSQAIDDVCVPSPEINIQLISVSGRDVLLVDVKESDEKPIYLKGKKGRKVFVRREDESVLASDEWIEVLKSGSKEEGVTFEYGEKERLLFRFLNEYSDITVERFSILINTTTYTAAKILVNLVSAGVLDLFERDGVAHYTFSKKSA
ncbi:MAG: ATP-binding protein [Balneola sp.]|nr:MAG: ATP-binding protein [Balneola sp.]